MNHLPWEGREGGYQGANWDTYDLIADELQRSFPNDQDYRLFNAVREALGDRTWCEQDPFNLREHELLTLSWTRFCEIVKHERRFLFWREKADDEGELLKPGKMLGTLGKFCRSANLVRWLPKGTRLVRASHEERGKQFVSVTDLGPPHEAKNPNRMSPVGIVMFYVSENAETALRETAREAGTYAVAEFETMKEVAILDLTDLPRVPSLFEANERGTRQSLIFLHSFVREFSKPLASDANEHVEYGPTQIVTEYFRATFQMGRTPIAGIRYPCAQHRNYSSIVLFADERNFVDYPANVGHEFQHSEKAWLSLVGVKDRVRIDSAMVKKWSV